MDKNNTPPCHPHAERPRVGGWESNPVVTNKTTDEKLHVINNNLILAECSVAQLIPLYVHAQR